MFFCVPVREMELLFLKTLLQKIKPLSLQVNYYPPLFFSIDSVLHIQEAQSRHFLSTLHYTINFFHPNFTCACVQAFKVQRQEKWHTKKLSNKFSVLRMKIWFPNSSSHSLLWCQARSLILLCSEAETPGLCEYTQRSTVGMESPGACWDGQWCFLVPSPYPSKTNNKIK